VIKVAGTLQLPVSPFSFFSLLLTSAELDLDLMLEWAKVRRSRTHRICIDIESVSTSESESESIDRNLTYLQAHKAIPCMDLLVPSCHNQQNDKIAKLDGGDSTSPMIHLFSTRIDMTARTELLRFHRSRPKLVFRFHTPACSCPPSPIGERRRQQSRS
jgi:hypothetical protein